MLVSNIHLPSEAIADFCRRWQITEFALFGSVLREDFRPDSDVDVLVSFASDARWTTLHFGQAIDSQELSITIYSMSIKPTWHDMERDTADWASARQLAWRRQAPAWAKLEAVNQLYQMGRTLAYSGLRQRHPGATPQELAHWFADRLLGSPLSAQVYHSSRQIGPTMLLSPIQVTLLVIDVLEALGVSYLIGGSVASAVYGVERMTMDTDIVADLRPEHVAPLSQGLGESFYMDVPSVLEAITRQGSFNIFHQATMFKVDIFIPKHRPFDQMQLSRRVEQPVAFEPEQRVYFASVEDTILAKLEWYRLGGEVSERQWRDVLGVIRTQTDRLDLGYLRRWAPELDVADLLELALVNAYH